MSREYFYSILYAEESYTKELTLWMGPKHEPIRQDFFHRALEEFFKWENSEKCGHSSKRWFLLTVCLTGTAQLSQTGHRSVKAQQM